jgi:hypothetical protein
VILLSSSLSDFPPKPGIIRTSVFRTFCHVPLPPG